MSTVAVIAHSGKTMDGGLGQLRDVLDAAGHPDALWFEVAKSKQAPDRVREAMDKGADLVFVWGGDGSVQRCIDTMAREKVQAPIAILPAGTANLLAHNLGIPDDASRSAVEVGLHGDRRRMDTATLNGEHFAVMAGAGLDALMIRDADGTLKDRLGRAAYLFTGARNLRASPVHATVKVDGRPVHDDVITCILVGQRREGPRRPRAVRGLAARRRSRRGRASSRRRAPRTGPARSGGPSSAGRPHRRSSRRPEAPRSPSASTARSSARWTAVSAARRTS